MPPHRDGTYGDVHIRARGRRSVAETRYRAIDVRLRKVSATADSPATARSLLKQRLLNRTGYGSGGPLVPHNVRRILRDMVVFAGLGDSGITLHWFRRTSATVIARGMGTGAAATFLGHTSTAITEGHYIAPDPTIDHTPAAQLERTLRPSRPDEDLLARPISSDEDAQITVLADADDGDAVASA